MKKKDVFGLWMNRKSCRTTHNSLICLISVEKFSHAKIAYIIHKDLKAMLPLLGMMMTVMATVTVTVTLTVTMIATNDCINISQLIDLNWQANFVWNLIFLCEEAVLQLSNYTWNIRIFIHWKEIIWNMFENNNAEATTFLFIDFHCNWWKQIYAYSLRNTIWRNWHFFHHSVSQWMFIDTEFWKKWKVWKKMNY